MRLRQAVVTLFGEAGSKIFEDREFAKASLTSHDSQFQKAALAVFYLHWGITEEIAHLLASLLTPGNHDESQKMAVLLLKRFHTNTGNQAAVFILRRAAEDKKLPEEVRKACLDALSGM
jgi:hypothetical protein